MSLFLSHIAFFCLSQFSVFLLSIQLCVFSSPFSRQPSPISAVNMLHLSQQLSFASSFSATGGNWAPIASLPWDLVWPEPEQFLCVLSQQQWVHLWQLCCLLKMKTFFFKKSSTTSGSYNISDPSSKVSLSPGRRAMWLHDPFRAEHFVVPYSLHPDPL